MAEVTKQ